MAGTRACPMAQIASQRRKSEPASQGRQSPLPQTQARGVAERPDRFATVTGGWPGCHFGPLARSYALVGGMIGADGAVIRYLPVSASLEVSDAARQPEIGPPYTFRPRCVNGDLRKPRASGLQRRSEPSDPFPAT